MATNYNQMVNRLTLLDVYPVPKVNRSNGRKVSSYAVFCVLDVKPAYRQLSIRDEDKAFIASETRGILFVLGVSPQCS